MSQRNRKKVLTEGTEQRNIFPDNGTPALPVPAPTEPYQIESINVCQGEETATRLQMKLNAMHAAGYRYRGAIGCNVVEAVIIFERVGG